MSRVFNPPGCFCWCFFLMIVATILWSMDVQPIWPQAISITRHIHHCDFLNYHGPSLPSDLLQKKIIIFTFSALANAVMTGGTSIFCPLSQVGKAASRILPPGLQSLETNDALFFGASWRQVFNWEKGRCTARRKLWGYHLVGFSSNKHKIRNLLNMCPLISFESAGYAAGRQASLR